MLVIYAAGTALCYDAWWCYVHIAPDLYEPYNLLIKKIKPYEPKNTIDFRYSDHESFGSS